MELMRTPVLRFVPTRRIECERGPVRVRAIHPTDALELERFYAAETAEVAIAVADEFQHRGIGRRLMAAGAAGRAASASPDSRPRCWRATLRSTGY